MGVEEAVATIGPVGYSQAYTSEALSITPELAAAFASTWLLTGLLLVLPPLWRTFSEGVVLQLIRPCLHKSTYDTIIGYLRSINLVIVFGVSGLGTIIVALTHLNGKNSQAQVEWATLGGLLLTDSIVRKLFPCCNGDEKQKLQTQEEHDRTELGRTFHVVLHAFFGFLLAQLVPDAPQLHQYFQYAGFLFIIAAGVSEKMLEKDHRFPVDLLELFSFLLLLISIVIVYNGPALPSYFLPYSKNNWNTSFLVYAWVVSIAFTLVSLTVWTVHILWPSIRSYFHFGALDQSAATKASTQMYHAQPQHHNYRSSGHYSGL